MSPTQSSSSSKESSFDVMSGGGSEAIARTGTGHSDDAESPVPVQRGPKNFTSNNDQTNESAASTSNLSFQSLMESSEEAAAELMMLANEGKLRKVSDATSINRPGPNDLLHACVEYLQKKTPGEGEVEDPTVLWSQMKSRSTWKEQIDSGVSNSTNALQQLQLESTATPTYPIQSIRDASKLSPNSSIAHLLRSKHENQSQQFQPHPERIRSIKQQPHQNEQVVREIFASLQSNNTCEHDFHIIILPDLEKTIAPPFLQYSVGTYLFVRPHVKIPSTLSSRILTEHGISSMKECRWKMTGPRVSIGNEFPARYMTPKTGSVEYNLVTRGVLYSRENKGGHIQAKILHVYRSEKMSRSIPATASADIEAEANASSQLESLPRYYTAKKKSEKLLDPPPISEGTTVLQVAPESKKRLRKAWSETEDSQLRQLVEGYTSSNERIRWVELSNEIPGRNGKQCRERWLYQLNANRAEYTPEEDALLAKLVALKGNKWREIQKQMPGRNDMDIKNRWNRLQRKYRKEHKKQEQIEHDQIVNPSGDEKLAEADALISLCDVALAKEQEDSAESTMESGDNGTDGSLLSELPVVGMRVRVRFEGDNGDYKFYEGTIIELQLAASDQSHPMNVYSNGNVDSSDLIPCKITIKYDDGSTEECFFPDPDIQLLTSNSTGEEMSLSSEREFHTKKRKRNDEHIIADYETHSGYVPLETVRRLLLRELNPIEIAMRLLPPDEAMLVRKKWQKSD